MMRDRILQATLALSVMAAAGCLSPRTDAPPMRTYQLTLAEWDAEARPADLNGPVLLVSLPHAEPGFETARMVYLQRPYELEHYATNRWADAPARMFTSVMVQSLGRSGSWRAVALLPGSIRGDYRLDSHGFALRQEFLKQPSRVRVTVRMQLINMKDSSVVGSRAFDVVENAPSEDAYGGVQAANQATAVLLDHISSWLQDCMRHSPACGQ